MPDGDLRDTGEEPAALSAIVIRDGSSRSSTRTRMAVASEISAQINAVSVNAWTNDSRAAPSKSAPAESPSLPASDTAPPSVRRAASATPIGMPIGMAAAMAPR